MKHFNLWANLMLFIRSKGLEFHFTFPHLHCNATIRERSLIFAPGLILDFYHQLHFVLAIHMQFFENSWHKLCKSRSQVRLPELEQALPQIKQPCRFNHFQPKNIKKYQNIFVEVLDVDEVKVKLGEGTDSLCLSSGWGQCLDVSSVEVELDVEQDQVFLLKWKKFLSLPMHCIWRGRCWDWGRPLLQQSEVAGAMLQLSWGPGLILVTFTLGLADYHQRPQLCWHSPAIQPNLSALPETSTLSLSDRGLVWPCQRRLETSVVTWWRCGWAMSCSQWFWHGGYGELH